MRRFAIIAALLSGATASGAHAIGGMAAVLGGYAIWALRRYPELRHGT